jgi:hypothetical protein
MLMKENRTDPVIDEIRDVRRRISARFDHDPVRLAAYYMELQERYPERLIGARETADPPESMPV